MLPLRFLPCLLLNGTVLVLALPAAAVAGPVANPNLAASPDSRGAPAGAPGQPAAPAHFFHPGVLLNQVQLDEIRLRVAAGAEPQLAAFTALRASPAAALNYVAHPRATAEGAPDSNLELGSKDEIADAQAAYAQALLWTITANPTYAQNAIRILNGWAATLRGGHPPVNGSIQAAWAGELWPRAAEIIRYSEAGWKDADIANFQQMLRAQYLPSLMRDSTENGDTELAMCDALIAIGVFNDDRAAYDLGVRRWRGRVPALVDGLTLKAPRHPPQANFGLAALVNAAETARQQGLDLYAEQEKPILAALEVQAQSLKPNRGTPPEPLEFNRQPTWEIAYNEYHDRLGQALPLLGAAIAANRPTGTDHMMAWETLTHGGMGDVGLPPVAKP